MSQGVSRNRPPIQICTNVISALVVQFFLANPDEGSLQRVTGLHHWLKHSRPCGELLIAVAEKDVLFIAKSAKVTTMDGILEVDAPGSGFKYITSEKLTDQACRRLRCLFKTEHIAELPNFMWKVYETGKHIFFDNERFLRVPHDEL